MTRRDASQPAFPAYIICRRKARSMPPAYDATRKRALFGFGNSATATYADLRELAL